MKIVELEINDNLPVEIEAISLVKEPAVEEDFYAFNAQKYYFETYNDYPQGAVDAARMGIKRNEELGNPCATQVGKVRAQQLINGENLTLDTIRRMRSFLIRHKDSYELARNRRDYNACGYISYLLWGGEAALPWAEKKLRQAGQIFTDPLILNTFAEIQKVSFDFDGVLTTTLGKELLQKEIDKGNQIYIISARDNKQPLIELATKYGINESNIYAVGSNLEKINTIKQLDINKHYDNNSNVVDELGIIGQQFTSLSQIEHEVFKHIFAQELGLEVGEIPDYTNAQRRLIGPVMIPNKLIRRWDEDNEEEYFVFFSEETIKKLQEKFMKLGSIHSSNIEHNGIPVDGVSMIESWIIEEPERDKSNYYGKQYPKGTWAAVYKIDNEEIWKKAERGEIRGFSVEGWFTEQLISKFTL
ncbi:hypothetical protein EB118_15620 [bacterium]|nr:hypothetical protein [bacterium]NDG31483.1 hypothetical protein [bacterium]